MANGEFNSQVPQLNSFSLQRSRRTPKDLAPLGAKPGSGTFAAAAKNDSAPTELQIKEGTAML